VRHQSPGSSTHAKTQRKKKGKYASWRGRQIQVITQKKHVAELDRNDPMLLFEKKKTLIKPVEAASSATTLFSGRIANGLTLVGVDGHPRIDGAGLEP